MVPLLIATCVNLIALGIILPVLPFYVTKFGIPTEQFLKELARLLERREGLLSLQRDELASVVADRLSAGLSADGLLGVFTFAAASRRVSSRL